MTEDQLFGEKDHAEEIRELKERNEELKNYNKWVWHEVKLMGEKLRKSESEKKLLHSFLVHTGLAEEYITWKRKMITNEEE